MNRFAGIDGGASRTDALISDAAGRSLARRQGPPALIRSMPAATVAGELVELLHRASDDAGGAIERVCFALTGVGREADRAAVEGALRDRGVPARSWLVVTDAEAALEDAFADLPGIVLIAGTGSVAWARRPDGSLTRAGGWGPILGDEGSGWAIGIAALRATVRTADGREPASPLASAILDATGLSDAMQLVHWADSATRASIAALAPIVLGLAHLDPTADSIIDDAARELARLVPPLRRGMAGPVDVALAGGLLAAGGPLRERLVAALGAMDGVRILDRTVDGARGAAAIARRANGTHRPQPATATTFGE